MFKRVLRPNLTLIDRRINRLLPVVDTFGEPHFELVRSRFRRITAMANVATEINGIIAADRAGVGGQRLGLSKHLTALLNDILALPAHADDRSRGEELAQSNFDFIRGEIHIVRALKKALRVRKHATFQLTKDRKASWKDPCNDFQPSQGLAKPSSSQQAIVVIKSVPR